MTTVRPMTQTDAVREASQIAEDVLFPAAARVESAQRVPRSSLDLLADRGFYGLCGAPEHGGLGVPMEDACRVIEQLAGGCLATTFVWRQHHSTVVLLRFGRNDELRQRFLEPMCSGEIRSGLAVNGPRAGADAVRARRTGSGYVLDGTVEWVTGWGLVDIIRVAARDEDGNVLQLLVDPTHSAGLRADPMRMIAANASCTVRLTFTGTHVPRSHLLWSAPPGATDTTDVRATRFVVALALGVAGRAATIAGAHALSEELGHRRHAVDSADEDTMPAARAAALDLAVRAAAAAVVTGGSSSVIDGAHASRLMREVLLLTGFAVPRTTRELLLDRLSAPGALG